MIINRVALKTSSSATVVVVLLTLSLTRLH